MTWRLRIWPEYAVEYAGRVIQLSRTQGMLLSRLWGGKSISIVELIEAAWEHDPEGGPDNARNCVAVHLCHLRKKLDGLPATILRTHDQRSRLVLKAVDQIAGIPARIIHEHATGADTMANGNRRREERCLRLERLYDDHEDLGQYLIALGQAVLDGDTKLRDMTVDHERETRTIDFNWGGDSGP